MATSDYTCVLVLLLLLLLLLLLVLVPVAKAIKVCPGTAVADEVDRPKTPFLPMLPGPVIAIETYM